MCFPHQYHCQIYKCAKALAMIENRSYSRYRLEAQQQRNGVSMTIKRIQTGPRMSQAVIHNKIVYLAGQVAPGASVTIQTREILASIDALLAQANTDKSRILMATIWLTDMATFAEMNSVWQAWVPPGDAPARATVMSSHLASAEFKIEIAVVAAQP
jgi:enamine deaminase RidA (YjgF/YER057c/UK114 family)